MAIIGPTRTDTGMAAKPIIEQMKVPTFMCVGGDPVITVPTLPMDLQIPPENLGGREEDLWIT